MTKKKISRFIAILVLAILTHVHASAQFKPHHTPRSKVQKELGGFVNLGEALNQIQNGQRAANQIITTPHARDIIRSEFGVPLSIELARLNADLPQLNPEIAVMALLESQAGILQILQPTSELELIKVTEDIEGFRHFRYRQVYAGVPIHNSGLLVHGDMSRINSINGRWFPTTHIDVSGPFISNNAVEDIIRNETGLKVLSASQLALVGGVQTEIEMRIYRPSTGKAVMVYHATVHPSVAEHVNMLINASDGTVLESVSAICEMTHGAEGSVRVVIPTPEAVETSSAAVMNVSGADGIAVLDGDVVANDQDLNGNSRSLHCYQMGSDFFMVDISRPMYNAGQSNLPNEPAGAVWTVDADGMSPQNQNFEISHVHSTNNKWNPLEVSAHWNGAKAYEYFTITFGRNSINGNGGTIISVIDVKDSDGAEMDNAFWNGYAMFYGNGNTAFSSPLARSLDVAGHEMSHGVIQNTANLEYAGQSGAMNESFADIFGAMIDRDDWLMGEEVVNPAIFPSGALRNLENPNNGGNQFGDNGWQPKHMNEFVQLPNTPQGDNGGVHVNSGIPNRAYYLFATDVGKDVAEKVYYRALSTYLVRSSQFVDLRIAVIKAAGDIHGTQSSVVQSARDAFAGVGILGDEGGDYEEDIEMNPGDAFLLVADNNLNDLFIVDPLSGESFELDVPPPFSKPSISDDGTAAVYVDQNGFLKAILFNWSQGTLDYEVIDIENSPQPIWRNISISKDGSKIAFLTDNLDNLLYVFDFTSQTQEVFELYNPTTGSGGAVTGGVEYAEAMEWDYSGQKIVYDAFNVIPGNFGNDIEYWDIGFLRAWDNGSNDFGTGQVQKLFTSLPENVSVGNPSFSKNSPHILAFDFLEIDDNFGNPILNWAILTANTQSGRVELLFNNDVVGFPNYSAEDDLVIFDTKDPADPSQLVIGAIDTDSDDIMLPVDGSARVYINGARYGTWFQTGVRDLTSAALRVAHVESIDIWPNPVNDLLNMELNEQPDSDAMIRIFNMAGSEVLTFFAGHGQFQHQINVSGLTQGLYTVEVSFNGKAHVGKFVKVR
ncbi:MAG: hypothetical protein DRI69_03975 [Bacteroidetes bacterium]|nr:MAG: hypothetical protein DRI69_03975 [Bacteroidota bacterium]